MFVAVNAAENLKIARSGVAIHTFVPFPLVFSAVNGEIHTIVIEAGRGPCRFCVAALTIVRELRGGVVGVHRLVIIICVAAKTSIRRIVVIPVVAGRAIIRNGCMLSVKGVVIIVDAKGCRIPSRLGSVAGGTIRCQPQYLVIGIGGIVEIHGMAGFTIRGGALIPFGMAQNAIRILVAARQGEIRIVVIKTPVGITCWVAGQTGCIFVSITAYSAVFPIRFRVDVAIDAPEFRIVGGVIMAIGTLRPLALVSSAIDRKQTIVLGKFGGHPTNIRGVAFGTTG